MDQINIQLIFACRKYQLDIIKDLIEKGADVNARTNYIDTPLMNASFYGHLEIVKYLVEHGANVNIRGWDYETPLMQTCDSSPENKSIVDIIKYLVENGADVNAINFNGQSVLYKAIKIKNPFIIKYLVEQGADINNKCVLYLLKRVCLKKILTPSMFRQLLVNNKLNSVQKTTLKRMLPACSVWNDTIEGYSKGYQKCACYFHTESVLNLVIASKK
jgi:hypothetical protein